jgi:hypothetical protein
MVREGMRGADQQQNHIFSYVSPEERVRKDHPLRIIRTMMDEVLQQLSRRLDSMYAKVGRPSIPPEQLLRAQLLQMLYSIRSEPSSVSPSTVPQGQSNAFRVHPRLRTLG